MTLLTREFYWRLCWEREGRSQRHIGSLLDFDPHRAGQPAGALNAHLALVEVAEHCGHRTGHDEFNWFCECGFRTTADWGDDDAEEQADEGIREHLRVRGAQALVDQGDIDATAAPALVSLAANTDCSLRDAIEFLVARTS